MTSSILRLQVLQITTSRDSCLDPKTRERLTGRTQPFRGRLEALTLKSREHGFDRLVRGDADLDATAGNPEPLGP